MRRVKIIIVVILYLKIMQSHKLWDEIQKHCDITYHDFCMCLDDLTDDGFIYFFKTPDNRIYYDTRAKVDNFFSGI